ncbi:MAG TPA: putative baseplate assembly protein [Myxococcaceae bacterium]|jgi:hypothetical protein
MELEYQCGTERRRRRVEAHPTLNGIAFLRVLDAEAAPLGLTRQRTLLVHCLKAVRSDLSGHNVQLRGGVRFTNVGVEWAFRADEAAARAPDPDAARAYYGTLADPERIVVVRTNSSGDFSPYTLALRRSLTDASPPEGFDLLLHQVDFSFKVECPTELDPLPTPAGAARAEEEPPIDYLTRDFASFRRLMLDRLAVVAPGWTERNPADLGMALVELLAYAADQLSYYQDAAATEAYLGTARRRVSVRRHARLLDYPMHDGCNARAFVALEISGDADGQTLPAGARMLTRVEAPVLLDASASDVAVGGGAQVFETLDSVTLHHAHGAIPIYTWADERCCLPAGSTSATLDDPRRALRLSAGDLLALEEVLDPESGLEVDADPAHRHVVRLTGVAHAEDPLDGRHLLQVWWAAEDALPFQLSLARGGGGERPASLARGNVVLADHGRSVSGEVLPAVPDSGRYRPRLRQGPLTQAARRGARRGAGARVSAAAELRWSMDQVMPELRLVEDGVWAWRPRRTLLDSGRYARDLVVEVEDDGRAWIRFGDGVMGQRPRAGASLVAAYRIGNGTAGNVGAGAIAHLVDDPALDWLRGVTRVRNPLPARGGVEPEPLEQVRIQAPQAFREKQRAVTAEDCAELACRHPEVQRAVGTLRWTGSWHTLLITVDRRGGHPVDEPFASDLAAFLERFRLAGFDLRIEGPTFVALDVAMTVSVAAGHLASSVRAALLDVFSNRDLPDGRRGFFHPDQFTFGQSVYLSHLVAAAMAVSGVDWVDTEEALDKPNHFRRWGQPSRGEWEAGAMTLDRVEIARLDNDPNQPENGRVDFIMRGGL